jgi:putative membrane protein
MKRVTTIAAFLAAVLSLGAAFAAPKVAGPDRKFMVTAAQDGMAEVKLGKLAQERASNNEVRDFGQHMVTEHSKANEELKSLASSKGVTLPQNVSKKHQVTFDRLSGLSGSAFDKAYMSAMVMDHQKAVMLFERESQNGKDPDVKAWAAKTLPHLKHHLDRAQNIAKKVGATASAR